MDVILTADEEIEKFELVDSPEVQVIIVGKFSGKVNFYRTTAEL